MINKIRKIIQIAFFLFTFMVFFGSLGDSILIKIYNALHIYPSLSSFAWFTVPKLFLVTLGLLIMVFLFGRLYCSFLCPAGFIQDIGAATRKLIPFKKKRRKVASPHILLRYFILALVFGFIVLQSSLYGYLDHFSNFGRMLNDLLFPFFDRSSRFQAPELPYVPSTSLIVSLVFFHLVFVLPMFRPRFYCNTLCPSGTLFATIAKYSPLQIIAKGQCATCKKCTVTCPANCLHENHIESTLCIGCFECLKTCKTGNFSLRWSFMKTLKKLNPVHELKEIKSNKRIFLASTLTIGGGLVSSWFLKKPFRIAKDHTLATTLPPGANCADKFFSKCTSCNQCLAVCPTGVIRSGGLENGLAGFAKPRLDYHRSYCSYECNACMAVCPTQALTYYPEQKKRLIRIGKVKLIKRLCIPYQDGKDCGACIEHCPTGAVDAILHNNVYAPKIIQKHCIGCGACEFACPVEPQRAIVVIPESIHSFAHDPVKNKRNSKPLEPLDNDFPF